MSPTIVQKQDLFLLIDRLIHDYRVIGPVETDSGFAFDKIRSPEKLRLDYRTTILPPKKYLLPTREVLLEFDRTDGQSVRPVFEASPSVIFGVHTCDLHAIHLLDAVFSAGYADTHYLKRRANTLIVSLECLEPCDEHSFCKSMGTLTAYEGYDLHLTDLGQVYAVDVGTEDGQRLLDNYATSTQSTPADIDQLNKILSEKWPRFPYRLNFDVGDLPSILDLSMKSQLWAELGERCLGCAACTNVCPTCFCFDVKDEMDLDLTHGTRVRSWDSCQLDEFATVAGGHNFRKSRGLRQRHRFLRKGKYILAAHKHLGCVGCGRCARACLVNITPVGVFNELHRQQDGGTKNA